MHSGKLSQRQAMFVLRFIILVRNKTMEDLNQQVSYRPKLELA